MVPAMTPIDIAHAFFKNGGYAIGKTDVVGFEKML
jgi:hypothetical protein